MATIAACGSEGEIDNLTLSDCQLVSLKVSGDIDWECSDGTNAKNEPSPSVAGAQGEAAKVQGSLAHPVVR